MKKHLELLEKCETALYRYDTKQSVNKLKCIWKKRIFYSFANYLWLIMRLSSIAEMPSWIQNKNLLKPFLMSTLFMVYWIIRREDKWNSVQVQGVPINMRIKRLCIQDVPINMKIRRLCIQGISINIKTKRLVHPWVSQ